MLEPAYLYLNFGRIPPPLLSECNERKWGRVHSLCVKNFGLMAFDSNNKRIGLDVYKQIKKLIFEYNVHRIEYCMISGNPVEMKD